MDTTKPSRKHHYLPRYYLKGFADEKNSFFVYDKTNDNIFKSSPNSIFFENNLNTVSIKNGQTSDFLALQNPALVKLLDRPGAARGAAAALPRVGPGRG